MDSDLDSDNSVFDVKSPTRENGGRRSSAAANNNSGAGDGGGGESAQPPPPGKAAVRSSSENTGDSCEKTCMGTMSGSSIA